MTSELVADFRKLRAARAIICALRFAVDRGGVIVLFGPSGAGKTTVLRCLAGLEFPEAGTIRFGDETWAESGRGLSPQVRGVGYVAQDYALFPHLSARHNIAYGLGRLSAKERLARTGEVIEMLRLGGLEERRPRELSGGEQQRVALGRALASRPRLLLLDEPLSALDAVTREQVRHDLREVLLRTGTPTLLVTHDRAEALTLGDSMVVMLDGSVRQSGPMEDLFRSPVDENVARLLGVETVVPGVVVESSGDLWAVRVGSALLHAKPGERGTVHAFVCIRAEDILLASGDAARTSARNQLPARVVALRWEGSTVRVELDAGFRLIASITSDAVAELGLEEGSLVTAMIKAPRVQLIARRGEEKSR